MLNYLGQAAWLLKVYQDPAYQQIENLNPFSRLCLKVGPFWRRLFCVGCNHCLPSFAFRIFHVSFGSNQVALLPRMQIMYPGSSIGQMYIPALNLMLWIACSGVVLLFRTSTRMEAAYGLAITVTMLMTTVLLYFFCVNSKSAIYRSIYYLIFAAIEGIFFISSAAKFFHGGFVAVLMAALIIAIMLIWEWGNHIQEQAAEEVDLTEYIPQLQELRNDETLPFSQTNVVFLVPKLQGNTIGRQFIYSILDKRPKRAKVYWFVNVEVTDEPYKNSTKSRWLRQISS